MLTTDGVLCPINYEDIWHLLHMAVCWTFRSIICTALCRHAVGTPQLFSKRALLQLCFVQCVPLPSQITHARTSHTHTLTDTRHSTYIRVDIVDPSAIYQCIRCTRQLVQIRSQLWAIKHIQLARPGLHRRNMPHRFGAEQLIFLRKKVYTSPAVVRWSAVKILQVFLI